MGGKRNKLLFSGVKFILATHTYNVETAEMLDFPSREIFLIWLLSSTLKQVKSISRRLLD